MAKTRRYFNDKQRLQRKKMLGHNLKVARVGAGYTQAQVMEIVWGVTNNRNRISEIENGHIEVSIELLAILADLYGCTSDYLLGRSCEPINDIYASHLNQLLMNTRQYFEPMLEAMVGSVTEFIKKVDKDEYLELVNVCEKVRDYTLANGGRVREFDEDLHRLLFHLEWIIRKISAKQAQKQIQIQAHIDDINRRISDEEGHWLWEDCKNGYQCSLPLPPPTIETVE